MIQTRKNVTVRGSADRHMLTDVFWDDASINQPLVIYCHGFNGFKDWGNFDLIANRFAEVGFAFIKFNFSHNGTTTESPEVFTDLEAFGNNNFSKELFDLSAIIDWSLDRENPFLAGKIVPNECLLLGHSMGGGIVLLTAATDQRVKKVATWASVNECKTPWGNWTEQQMQEWKASGVAYYLNGRTQQQMPLYYQLYEDYQQNAEQLNIKSALEKTRIPMLFCHGLNDPAVPVEKAYELKQWYPNSALLLVESDHVFGRSHPAATNNLPESMETVLSGTIEFLSYN